GIVDAQVRQGSWFMFKLPSPIGWFGLPFGILASLTFLTAATAEVNRVPFDLPEAESELVAGYFAEYTGMRFALFQLGEYGEMFGMAAVATIMCFGGWTEPHLQPYMWLLVTLGCLVVAAVILTTGLRQTLLVRPILMLAGLGLLLSLVMVFGTRAGLSQVLPSLMWFLAQMFALVFFLVWVRWSYAPLREAQVQGLALLGVPR